MYGPMSRNRNSYGHQPFANVVESNRKSQSGSTIK